MTQSGKFPKTGKFPEGHSKGRCINADNRCFLVSSSLVIKDSKWAITSQKCIFFSC